MPFDALAPLSPSRRAALRKEAFRVNDRYLFEFIEALAFCPYSRKGRELGEVRRYFYYADTLDIGPLVDLGRSVAADPGQVVAQVIMPLIEVDPAAWCTFCQELRDLVNADIDHQSRLVTAALHPHLPFSDCNEFTLIPLFRRSPDPTIQWVRQAPLDELYSGRGRGTSYVAPEDASLFLAGPPPKTPLYDRIAQTNAATTRRLQVDKICEMAADYHADARDSYARILGQTDEELDPQGTAGCRCS